ncbi:MAG: nitronate monooxygenase [Capsulimonadaceae bacterium]|nr:nitronate monooxygenase [Capsulimonadaceae bacterium]
MSVSSVALPRIIQGGMGIGVSDWRLAREVSRLGQLGVVSGTGIDLVIPRRLQLGDIGGHIRRALAHFPIPEIAEKIVARYLRPESKASLPFLHAPELRLETSQEVSELSVCSNFAEVWLAKDGHSGLVGINYLEKIQMSHLPALYGAMLAGVDFVLIGAGIPLRIPDVLDKLAVHEPAAYRITVECAPSDSEHWTHFDPKTVIPNPDQALKRPNFLPIVSSATLAEMFLTRATAKVNGLIVERYIAGGHNAPPRGKLKLDETSQPIYGDRDIIDVEKIRALGAPFWLAGGYASPEGIADALNAGAVGVQIGSLFALAEESALHAPLKRQALDAAINGTLTVKTDPFASPSGFPFKVAVLPGTLADDAVYEKRKRICDVTRLRKPYMRPDGTVGYRCPSEPAKAYLQKGGKEEDLVGRKCLCNALLADVGLFEHHADGYVEPALVTLGDDLSFVPRVLTPPKTSYTTAEAIAYLTGDPA